MRRLVPAIALSLGLLVQTTPVHLHAWGLEDDHLSPVPIPHSLTAVFALMQEDLDGNSLPETIMIEQGQVSIVSPGGVAWKSPAEWQVLQAALTDLDGDAKTELSLLLWRPFRPWPVDQWLPNGGRISTFQNSEGNSCHFIMIGWRNGSYREIWAGSAMSAPVTVFAAADLDGDQIQELVTLESLYSESITHSARALKVWEWNGFGFTIVYKLEGNYTHLAIVHSGDGRILILVS